MRKSVAWRVVVFSLLACFLIVSVPVIVSAQKVITLNYANFFQSNHKNSILAEAWCKEIEKRTNGRVKISYFPGGTLSPANLMYDNVVKGIADIGFSVLGYTRGRFPMMGFLDNPLGYKSGTQATALVMAYYKKFKPKELDDVRVLYLHGHGPGILHTKKPVTKLEDLKGMKIRAQGTVVPIVQALGGAPVGASMPETYEALRTGVVEGSMAPMEALQGWKWGEIIKSTTENYGSAYTASMFVVMNKNKWNSLPGDIKKIFDQVSAEWVDKQARLWDDIDKEGREFSVKRGNKIIALSKEEDARWAAKVRPILDDYAKNLNQKKLPGDEALKFCLDFITKGKK